jgi:hypothetical protein
MKSNDIMKENERQAWRGIIGIGENGGVRWRSAERK